MIYRELCQGGYGCGCWDCTPGPIPKTVTRDTQAPAGIADTSNNREAIPHPLPEIAKMFSLNTFESNVTKLIAAATLAALVASLI